MILGPVDHALLFQAISYPMAIDDFFHQVERHIVVMVRGFKADLRILLREREQLAGQIDLGLQTLIHFHQQAMLLFRRQGVWRLSHRVAGEDKASLIGNRLEMDCHCLGVSQFRLDLCLAIGGAFSTASFK